MFYEVVTAALPLSPLCFDLELASFSLHAELNISRSSVGKILLEIEKKKKKI